MTVQPKSSIETAAIGPQRGLIRRTAVPSLMAAGAVGAFAHFRRRFEHSQMFLPEVYPNGIWDPTPFGLDARDCWFESADGVRLHGWWIPHRWARGAVLYCHGNAGNLSSQIGAYRALRKLRLSILAFDYRGYGRSEGKPSEQGLFGDVRAAHDYLTHELEQDPSRIVLYGHSLGGAVAIDCALHRQAAALVAQSTFTNTKEVARTRFASLPVHWLAQPKFRSIDKVPQIEIPKFFIHGTEDGTIPHAMGDELFQAAAEPKQWVAVDRAGHLDVHRHGGTSLHWKLARFLRAALKQAR